jgi:hypothetical protein
MPFCACRALVTWLIWVEVRYTLKGPLNCSLLTRVSLPDARFFSCARDNAKYAGTYELVPLSGEVTLFGVEGVAGEVCEAVVVAVELDELADMMWISVEAETALVAGYRESTTKTLRDVAHKAVWKNDV